MPEFCFWMEQDFGAGSTSYTLRFSEPHFDGLHNKKIKKN